MPTMTTRKRARELAAEAAARPQKRPKTSTPSAEHPSRAAQEPSRSIEVVEPPPKAGLPPPTDLASFVIDRPSPPYRQDDADGHYVFQLGENLSPRFKILSKMGEGTFGRVLECWDRKHHSHVAVKIVRNVQKYRDAAMIELEVLNTLSQHDPERRYHCVHLLEWFDYRGHVCMVFEKLGLSLYDYLRRNHYDPFEVSQVKAFARQLLQSTTYLHSLHLIHTDMKPENILLTKCEEQTVGQPNIVQLPQAPEIRVIDFGSATFQDQYHSTVVSTRHYRAPEVILGLGWSFPADIWSIGCILVELCTGDALFQTHENLEHLAMMEQVLGRIPTGMVQRANRPGQKMFHHRTLELLWPGKASRRSLRAVDRLMPVRKLLAANSKPTVRPHAEELGDLVERMLRFEPAQRISARKALQHPFFSSEEQPA